MTTSPLEVKLASFEGPLDLLLHLIQENKVDIFDIPIALITEQYLEHISLMKELDLDISGDFLVMAATLIFIKSKMLLPLEEDQNEEDQGIDPRDELVKKLLEYQSFKEAAKELGMLAHERSRVFTRQMAEEFMHSVAVDYGDADFNASLFDLMQAFSRVLRGIKSENYHEVREEVISIEEKISEIRGVILEKGEITFTSLFPAQKTRNMLIASFFAILELGKQRFLTISQPDSFGEIVLRRKL